MKLNYFIPALLVLLAFSSCKNDVKNESPETVEVTSGNDVTQSNSKKPTIGDVAFNDPNMAVIFREYLGLKNALVSSNAAEAGASAVRLRDAFISVNAGVEALTAVTSVIEASHISEQRTALVEVTAAVEALLEDEIASGTIYKQYCPMAFDNTGASWLSASSDIMNPYFGDKMLRCGRIDGKIE